MGHEYASMQRMLNQLNKPFPNVGKYMDINAIGLMLLVPLFLQVERLAEVSPSGYAPVLLVLGTLAFGFFVVVLEAIIGILIFSGIGWMMNVPGFFAIGVVQGIDQSEQRYRDIHIGFYKRLQLNVLFTGLVLIVYSIFGIWSFVSSMMISHPIVFGIIFALVLPITSAHLLVHFISERKQQKWETISDTQIHTDVELKRQRLPQLASAPSVDEMEEILRNAKIGDIVSQTDAEIINKAVSKGTIKNVLWMIIFFTCILLLFV